MYVFHACTLSEGSRFLPFQQVHTHTCSILSPLPENVTLSCDRIRCCKPIFGEAHCKYVWPGWDQTATAYSRDIGMPHLRGHKYGLNVLIHRGSGDLWLTCNGLACFLSAPRTGPSTLHVVTALPRPTHHVSQSTYCMQASLCTICPVMLARSTPGIGTLRRDHGDGRVGNPDTRAAPLTGLRRRQDTIQRLFNSLRCSR